MGRDCLNRAGLIHRACHQISSYKNTVPNRITNKAYTIPDVSYFAEAKCSGSQTASCKDIHQQQFKDFSHHDYAHSSDQLRCFLSSRDYIHFICVHQHYEKNNDFARLIVAHSPNHSVRLFIACYFLSVLLNWCEYFISTSIRSFFSTLPYGYICEPSLI